jgi:hypothetical protein
VKPDSSLNNKTSGIRYVHGLAVAAIATQVGPRRACSRVTAPFVAVTSKCAQPGLAECGQFGGVDALANAIYVGAAIPFELVSVLLLVAIVGAIAVARGHTDAEKKAKDPAELDPRPRSADPNATDPSGITPAE